MSKQVKRKITVNLTSKSKEVSKPRPSVFERLGTKASTTQQKDFCHHWAQSGTCPYGKGCKYSSTHTLISPSKQRAAKNQTEPKRRKENAHKRLHAGNPDEDWDQWDPEELADADPDDLEKRRQELQRELELQVKMEHKARKKDKKPKKESSPSTESSSTSSDTSSSSDDSSSSSSSSTEARRKKSKKTKSKRDSSSSSDERPAKKKPRSKRTSSKSAQRGDKIKKISKLKAVAKSPSPARIRKQSLTPPLKIKPGIASAKTVETKSPRPTSRSSDRKEKHLTPSPKPKEREKEKEKEREKEREKEKEREREKEREKEREREREREKERAKERAKEKEKERDKDKEHKKKDSKSPKRDTKNSKESKKRDTPDSSHSRDRKLSPSRSKGSGSSSKRESHKSPPPKDERTRDKKDDKDRSRAKERDDKRKDKRDSRDRDRERERERERRLAREEREAAREKEREEALARCQERQRERERLKELAKKEEERTRGRDRNRREDRGLDKPSGDRVERLLPLPEDRVPPSRKHSSDRERSDRRERERRERTPERRKSAERRDIDKERIYDRSYDRSADRSYDRESRDHERDREYPTIPPRVRETERRLDEKEYDSPYDRTTRHEDRRYLDIDDHYNENSRDERLPVDTRDFPEDRRSRRDLWEARDERDLDLEHRRYPRDDSRQPASLKGRDWETEYPDHDWDRARRPMDWEGRENWEGTDHKHMTEEDWRLYNWTNEERRRWAADWRERSRPRSSTSHNRDDESSESRRKEAIIRQDQRSDRSDSKASIPEPEVKKEPVVPVPVKRPAEEPIETPVEIKKPCIVEPVLEDDLSEISDDADEILNREEITEPPVEEAPAPEPNETSSIKDQPNSAASQKSQSPSRSPNRLPKDEPIDEENMDLDFEEISDDELEEESRVKGIGDALGVDWASLIAESRPRNKPISSAKRRWESHNVLVNLGISVELAGETLVKDILREHAEAKIKEEEGKDGEGEVVNGVKEEDEEEKKVEISHPLGAIQVANREKQAMRKALFSNAGPNCRALSARRDLMIRRHLCNLPLKDTYVEAPKRHDPELLKLAVQMFERCL